MSALEITSEKLDSRKSGTAKTAIKKKERQASHYFKIDYGPDWNECLRCYGIGKVDKGDNILHIVISVYKTPKMKEIEMVWYNRKDHDDKEYHDPKNRITKKEYEEKRNEAMEILMSGGL